MEALKGNVREVTEKHQAEIVSMQGKHQAEMVSMQGKHEEMKNAMEK